MSEKVQFNVGTRDAGRRLDMALGERPEVGSRARAQRLIDAGRVVVDGERRPKRHRLQAGQRVQALLLDPAPPGGIAASFRVAFEDDYLMVVDKPAGVVVHPSTGHSQGTLVQALGPRAAGGAQPDRPGIVHRLDRDTSGLLVVAKCERAHRGLQQLIRSRKMERDYLALVEGHPDAEAGTIDAPLGRDRANRTLVSTRTDKPRSARTHFRRLERLPRTSLLGVRLETGRTHQIRAHLAAIGHPVCGDARYGGRAAGERLGLTRQFLHSEKLAFKHPILGAPVSCESNLPADLQRAIEAARREPASAGPDGG